MKKLKNWAPVIVIWVVTLAVIGLAIWGIVAVLRADIPAWLKFAILKG